MADASEGFRGVGKSGYSSRHGRGRRDVSGRVAARQAQSLAGQTATVMQRDGTRKLIRFGRDVRLRRDGVRPPGTTRVLQPVIEGHIDSSERAFEPDDQQLGAGRRQRVQDFV